MTIATTPTFTATVYVGLKHRESGEIRNKSAAVAAVQAYVDSVGLCASITDTQFVYTNGCEPGLAVGLINYPRFPSSPEQIRSHAIAIAEMLLGECKQSRVSVVMPNETVMISAPGAGNESPAVEKAMARFWKRYREVQAEKSSDSAPAPEAAR